MRICLFVLALSILPTLARAENPVHEGKWEVTSTMNMPGMPMQIPPQTHTQCITKKNPVPHRDSPQAKDCTPPDFKVDGNKVTWSMTCQGKAGPNTINGTITYGKNTFDGNMDMKMNNQHNGQSMDVTVVMTGKRLGDCDAN